MASSYFGAGRLILVVDDNPDFLLAMEHLLATLGFSVATARNGAEGLARLHRVTPAVILLDLFMPFMDGTDFMRHVQAIGKPVPPVIAVTGDMGMGRDAVSTAIQTLGVRAILLKPFTADQLGAALGHVLSPVVMYHPDHPATPHSA